MRGNSGLRGSPREAASAARLPDFIVIGAMKGGTTTLVEYLRRDPRIFMSRPKEPQFFSRDEKFQRGFDWYGSLFAQADPEQVCGEASTCYSRWPAHGDVAERIARHLPEVRLVYVVRHPVDRAYSHYGHVMQERFTADAPILSFEEALEELPELVDASLYRTQLERYLRFFPREAILVLSSEDLYRSPEPPLGELQRFLGLQPLDLLQDGPVRANPRGEMVRRRQHRKQLARLRQAPGLSRAIDWLPGSLRRRLRGALGSPAVGKLLTRGDVAAHQQALSPLQASTRKRLLERFRGPNRELELYLGRELPGWSA